MDALAQVAKVVAVAIRAAKAVKHGQVRWMGSFFAVHLDRQHVLAGAVPLGMTGTVAAIFGGLVGLQLVQGGEVGGRGLRGHLVPPI